MRFAGVQLGECREGGFGRRFYCRDRGGELRAIDVRLGVLAGGSPDHLREHFEVELRRRGATGIELRIEEQPAYPGGVEITGIELR